MNNEIENTIAEALWNKAAGLPEQFLGVLNVEEAMSIPVRGAAEDLLSAYPKTGTGSELIARGQ